MNMDNNNDRKGRTKDVKGAFSLPLWRNLKCLTGMAKCL